MEQLFRLLSQIGNCTKSWCYLSIVATFIHPKSVGAIIGLDIVDMIYLVFKDSHICLEKFPIKNLSTFSKDFSIELNLQLLLIAKVTRKFSSPKQESECDTNLGSISRIEMETILYHPPELSSDQNTLWEKPGKLINLVTSDQYENKTRLDGIGHL